MAEKIGIKIMFLARKRISIISWWTNSDLIKAKSNTEKIINERITADFRSPIKRVRDIHEIKIIINETIIGMIISLIGISWILSENNSNTGRDTKIKWWNPNLVNTKY